MTASDESHSEPAMVGTNPILLRVSSGLYFYPQMLTAVFDTQEQRRELAQH